MIIQSSLADLTNRYSTISWRNSVLSIIDGENSERQCDLSIYQWVLSKVGCRFELERLLIWLSLGVPHTGHERAYYQIDWNTSSSSSSSMGRNKIWARTLPRASRATTQSGTKKLWHVNAKLVGQHYASRHVRTDP